MPFSFATALAAFFAGTFFMAFFLTAGTFLAVAFLVLLVFFATAFFFGTAFFFAALALAPLCLAAFFFWGYFLLCHAENP